MPNEPSLRGDIDATTTEAARRTGLSRAACKELFMKGFALVDELGKPLVWEKRF